MTYSCYKISNIITGESYFGITGAGVERRWKQHTSPSAKSYVGKCIQQYGVDNFLFECLAEGLSGNDAKMWELVHVQSFNTLYPNGMNIAKGGGSSLPTGEYSRRGQLAANNGVFHTKSFDISKKKWKVQFVHMRKHYHLDYFDLENDADKLSKQLLTMSDQQLLKFYEQYKVSRFNSRRKGYVLNSKGSFEVKIVVNGKKTYFGAFKEEADAKAKASLVYKAIHTSF